MFRFYHGPMSSGKSTLVLQTAHNMRKVGKQYILFTTNDRSRKAKVTSRLGIEEEAKNIDGGTHIDKTVLNLVNSEEITLLFDEAQFYLPGQVDQIARLVDRDDIEVDAYAFGLLKDFQSRMFAGSKRCLELADEIIPLQLGSRCWCGKLSTHDARTNNGSFVSTGPLVVVGDSSENSIGYESLCRKHWVSKITRKEAKRIGLVGE